MNLALPTVRQDTAPPVSIFEPDTLARMESYQGYRSATPYPHAIFDDLFDPEALRTILREWPNDNLEQHNDGTFVRKNKGPLGKRNLARTPRAILQTLRRPSYSWRLKS